MQNFKITKTVSYHNCDDCGSYDDYDIQVEHEGESHYFGYDFHYGSIYDEKSALVYIASCLGIGLYYDEVSESGKLLLEHYEIDDSKGTLVLSDESIIFTYEGVEKSYSYNDFFNTVLEILREIANIKFEELEGENYTNDDYCDYSNDDWSEESNEDSEDGSER